LRIQHCIAASLFFLLMSSSPSFADILCVQQQLTDLGFSPGPVDGAAGKRTFSAAAIFAANSGLALDPLTEENSDEWCEALTAFADTPAAQTISHLDLISEPEGILSSKDQAKLWDAYKTAKACFEHPTYGAGSAQLVDTLATERFNTEAWSSPFTTVVGAPTCTIDPGNISVPRVVSTVTIDEAYGQRVASVDIAAAWFRRLTAYVRLTNDPVAKSQLKQGVLEWASGKGLAEGIHVSWGHKPVDWQMMTTILAILSATAQLADDFGPEERAVVGPWLNDLVKQSAAGYWKDRQDNKALMRTYIALIWGLMTGDDKPVQDAIFALKLAIHDMRPDGSWPIDSQRGGMGLVYGSDMTSSVASIAIALKSALGIDLFDYQVDGRSLHTAIEFMVEAIKSPGPMNSKYAIACEGGDRFGSIDEPNLDFLPMVGYLTAYATLFPDRPASLYISERFPADSHRPNDQNGGDPACLFALTGGSVSLPPLDLPEPPPEMPAPKLVVHTKLHGAEHKGDSDIVSTHMGSTIEGGPKGADQMGFSIKGMWSQKRDNFAFFSFTLHAPLGEKLPDAVAACKPATDFYDGQHHLMLKPVRIGDDFEFRNVDCIIDALPKEQVETVRLLIDHLQDVAIGIVADGQLEIFEPLALQRFFERVAFGEVMMRRDTTN
jgi:hypothetical protein